MSLIDLSDLIGKAPGGRKLIAVVYADMVGYSRLIGLDDEGTAERLRALRSALIDPAVDEHGGRIVQTGGDSLLIVFDSIDGAVRCAVKIQQQVPDYDRDHPSDRTIRFRVGINLGDVIADGTDLHGEGVNVAARLQAECPPGAVCVSRAIRDHVHDRLDLAFEECGKLTLKNIARPVEAFVLKFGPEIVKHALPGTTTLSPPSAPRLSIVVLPFANIGGDPEQDYFVDGVTESLTTDLSRMSGSFVIARNTAFTFKGRAVDVKRVGRELNVRYVLEGSVQRGGNRLRVNVQLVDAETGNHLWAERFEKPIADLFDMQDEIVSRLANILNAQLIEAEARRAERSLHPDAMELYFQCMACFNKGRTAEYTTRARGFFERALALDPKNIEALVAMAEVDEATGTSFLADDRAARFAAAETALIKALSLAPQHAQAHWLLGRVKMFTNRAAQGVADCEQALALDRNLASAHGEIGHAKYFLGRGAETEAHVQEALRLSPRDTDAFVWMMFAGLAKLQIGADEEAVARFRRSVEINRNHPRTHFSLAAALAHLGRLDEARSAVQAGLALNPSFTIRSFRAGALGDNPTYLAGRERTYEGMRMAAVPEG